MSKPTTPVFESASNHRYHTYDYLAVDPLLGGDEALGALLDALKSTGIRLRSLRQVLSGSEVLEDHLRQQTRTIMGVDTSDNYGSTEAFVAWQCHGGKWTSRVSSIVHQ